MGVCVCECRKKGLIKKECLIDKEKIVEYIESRSDTRESIYIIYTIVFDVIQ